MTRRQLLPKETTRLIDSPDADEPKTHRPITRSMTRSTRMNYTNVHGPEAATDLTTILTEDEDRQTTDDEGTGSDGEQGEDVEANSGQMQG